MTPVSPVGGEADVARLREVAEAATPGPWLALGCYVAHEIGHCTCGAGFGAMPHEGGCGLEDLATATASDAEHIATFDPPTVLALLARLEAAESARDEALAVVERVRALADEWRAEAERYTGYGEGNSPSHAQCRQIAHTLGESADALAALTPSAPTEETQA